MTILIFLHFTSFSQSTGEIKGKVLDAGDPAGLPGAHVYVEIAGEKVGTVTDENGKYTIKPLNSGSYNVHVSFMGYQEKMITNVIVNPDKITFMDNIILNPGIEIGVIEKLGFTRKLIDIEDPSKMSMQGAELVNLPDRHNLPMVLRAMSAEVQVSDDGRDIHFRGARSGTSVFYIDGVKHESLSDALPGNSIGSITVYSGGIPAKYGDFTGGAVIIETKSYFDYLSEWKAKQAQMKNNKED